MRWPRARRYVAVAGSDAWPGTRRNPKATIQGAIDSLPERGGVVELAPEPYIFARNATVEIPAGVCLCMFSPSWWRRWLRL